ncbi:L10-interacting MYB domain-containing protein-like protein [Tanacetum coccineum]
MGYPVLPQPSLATTGQPHMNAMGMSNCHVVNGVLASSNFHPMHMNSGNGYMDVNCCMHSLAHAIQIAISKISTVKCTSKDLKPVLQVIFINTDLGAKNAVNGKELDVVVLSDGDFMQLGFIPRDIFISNKLQKGSIVKLTEFQFINTCEIIKSGILGLKLTVIHIKCGIVGDPKSLPDNESPLVERTTPTIPDEDHANSHHVEEPPKSKQIQDHVDSLLNEDIDDCRHHVEEPPTSIQNPSTSTQKCSSHSPTQNKKRKLQSSDGDHVLYKKLETLEEDVSKMTRMMMEKNKEVDVGFKKLETLEEDVSIMTRMMIEKYKEDDVGACYKKLETVEEDVPRMTIMMMEKNKKDAVGFKMLETLEEDVFKVAKMIMDKNKEDDVDASYKKLKTLEENVSKMAKKMMDKNKEDDVGTCFKKLERLEEDVSKLTRLTMEKNKEDDIGACIEKLDKIGWVAQDPMYDTAILLFGQSADYRKLWLHLKPESCGNWVKNAGKMTLLVPVLLLSVVSADSRKRWLHLKPESCGKWVKNAGRKFGLLG